MNATHRLNRRQFTAGCAALGLLPAIGAAGISKVAAHTVTLPDGTAVPALGQGTWHLGQGRHQAAVEREAVNAGIAAGMTLLDTSGNYGNGRSEEFVGHVIAGQRDRIYLVTKVESDEVLEEGIPRACDASLGRLATDHIDLYLLHSPVPINQFAGVVAHFEKLRAAGKIRAWGVSNFDLGQMQALYAVPDGHRCATNQVNYSLRDRGIERGTLQWCSEHKIPVMAYSPLGGDTGLVMGNHAVAQVAAAHGCPAAAVALAWVMRSGTVIAIPESGSPAHTKENAAALSVSLTPEDLKALDAAYPGPGSA
jgi:diketogulonate reductase-like aldo/keto reductase